MVEEDNIPEEKLIDVSKEKNESETESDTVIADIKKKNVKASIKRLTGGSKIMGKGGQESSKRKREESAPIKGQGSVSKKVKVEHILSKEERIQVLEKQKVLSGRGLSLRPGLN